MSSKPKKPPRGSNAPSVPIHEAIQQVHSDFMKDRITFDSPKESGIQFPIANTKPIPPPKEARPLPPPPPPPPSRPQSMSPQIPSVPPPLPPLQSFSAANNPFEFDDDDAQNPMANQNLPANKNQLAPPKPVKKAPVVREVEPFNPIYHRTRYSPIWLLVAVAIHIAQLTVLLMASERILGKSLFVVLVIFACIVTLLLLSTRFFVRMKKHSFFDMRNRTQFTPEDETDEVPDAAIYALAGAAVLEGFLYATIAVLSAGVTKGLNSDGFYTQNTILQSLRFGSITLLAIHRIIRPSNRVDPVRTILELEVVSVCWDALDGSTLCELIDGQNLTPDILASTQALMVFWYFSVGIRMAFMFLTHMSPESKGYQLVLTQPLALSPQPTVDRTMQGLTLRSTVILIMACAEFYAAGIRITLWSKGQLDAIQQDMTIKNILFLSAVMSAYMMRSNANNRDWNTPEIGFGLRYPSREFQVEFFRWLFAVVYVVQGMLLSLILIQVSQDSVKWVANIAFDIILALFFLIYCRNVHIQRADLTPTCFLFPKEGFVMFPAYHGLLLSSIMMLNLYVARVPVIFYSYDYMNDDSVSGQLWSFDNALMVINLSVITIGACGMFWSLSYMVFRKEFTASPGNYNSIHDPTISMVATSTMIEGALDVLSCSALLQLAEFDLPNSMEGACVVFGLLELVNACQSFGLQAILSGGHDDTPMDLVRWKALLRGFRFFIDFGTFVLRTILWVKYKAISSVFLIKNLYNLLHTAAQIERSYGVSKYPKGTLFTEFVPPAEWYGMSKEEWRDATRHTLAAQARAGRTV